MGLRGAEPAYRSLSSLEPPVATNAARTSICRRVAGRESPPRRYPSLMRFVPSSRQVPSASG